MWDMIIAYMVLATGIVANKYVLRVITPDFLVALRMGVSGFFILLYALPSSPRLRWSYLKNDIAQIVLIALFTSLIPALLKAFALRVMDASKQTLLGSIDPFITALYAYLIWGERLTGRKVVGMCIGVLGLIYSVVVSVPSDRLWTHWFLLALPECAVLLAVALGRYGWIFTQIMIRKERYKPYELTSVTMFISGLFSLALALIRGKNMFVGADMTATVISALLYTIFVGNILGYNLYSYCLKHNSATILSITGFLVPLFVALGGALCGLEEITYHFFISLFLVAAGILIFYSASLWSKASGCSTL